MAFPNDSERKFKVTIDSDKIASAVSGLPIRILLEDAPSDMMDAGSLSCLNGGGDIRAGNADGSTRYPLEVVRCVTSASAGSRELELHVKVTDSISSSSDTDVWIYYKEAGATQPAASSTYGSEKVWDSDYELVSHDGGKTNSTSGSNPSVFTTEPSVTSGKDDDTDARDYGSRTEIEGYSLGISGTTEYTFEHQLYSRSVDNNAEISFYRIDFSGFTSQRYGYQFNDEFWLTDDTNYLGGTLANITEDTWHMVSLAQDGGSDGEIYVDGSSVYSGSSLNAPDTAETSLFMGVAGTGSAELDGLIGEVRYSKVRRTDAWINATAENINDQSNFFNHTPVSESTATDVEVTATTGDVTVTSTDATVVVEVSTEVTATTGNVTVTSLNAIVNVETDTTVTATTGNVSVSSLDTSVSVEVDTLVTATTGDVTITSTNPTVLIQRDVEVVATTSDVTVTKVNPTVSIDTEVTATTGDVTISKVDPTVYIEKDYILTATTGNVLVEGASPSVSVGSDINVTAGTSEVSVTSLDTTVTYVENEDVEVTATTGNVTINSLDTTVVIERDVEVTATTGNVSIVSDNTSVIVEEDINVTATEATVVVTSQDTNVSYVLQWMVNATAAQVVVDSSNTTVEVPDETLNARGSRLYLSFITNYEGGGIDLVNDTIKVVPVSKDFQFNLHDEYLSDVSSEVLSPSVELTGPKRITDDTFKYGDRKIQFISAVGDIEGFLMYKDTGVSSTSELISFHKEDFKGITKGMSSELLEWVPNTGGFFKVEPEDVYVGRTVSYIDRTPRSNIRN